MHLKTIENGINRGLTAVEKNQKMSKHNSNA